MGLKHSIVSRCALILAFFFPFTEHRVDRFNIILEGPRILGMANEHWLQHKVMLVTKQRVSLSFEAQSQASTSVQCESPRWHLPPIIRLLHLH